MLKDLVLIVISALSFVAAVLGILTNVIYIKNISNKNKRIKGYIGINLLFLLIFLVFFFIYKKFGKIPDTQIIYPPITVPIDVSGSYTGNIIDVTGHKVAIYLKIQPINYSDSILLIFKNDFTDSIKGKYLINDNLIYSKRTGILEVSRDSTFIILSSTNNSRIKCEFRKLLRTY